MNKGIKRYWAAYKFSMIFELLKNMGRSPQSNSDRFEGKTVVITGATSGIGYYTAKKFAAMGSHVIMINRSLDKSKAVADEIFKTYGCQIDYFVADLSSLEDIKRVGHFLLHLEQPIDVLIHNAGVHLEKRKETSDGLEVNFVVHYLCPLIMTHMLLPKYRKDQRGRILLVSSEAYRFAAWGLDLEDLQWVKRKYTGLKAYGSNKLAQILSMHQLSDALAPYHTTINAMHPGMVRTDSGKDNSPFYQWYKRNLLDKISSTADISAEAIYYLGTSSELSTSRNLFFHLTTPETLAPPAQDTEAAEALWLKTQEILKEFGVSL